MKPTTFPIVLALTALLLVSFFRSNAWAPSAPPDEPPHGVAIQSDAKGTKLSGVVFMELIEINANLEAAAGRTCARFRQGPDVAMFCGMVPGPLPIDSVDSIVNALKNSDLMRKAVTFFSPGDEVVATKIFEELTFLLGDEVAELARIKECLKAKKDVITVADTPIFAMVDVTFTLGSL